jgi:dTDP-4-amino-4,6-dideoxygalactose transaminase
VLNAKLPLLDAYCESRRVAAGKYSDAFRGQGGLQLPKIVTAYEGISDTGDCHVFHQYTLRITDGKRDALAEHLAGKGVPFGIYYPIPLHRQKAYADERYNEKEFPVTNQLVKEVISLPMHTELDDEQISFIADSVKEFFNS